MHQDPQWRRLIRLGRFELLLERIDKGDPFPDPRIMLRRHPRPRRLRLVR